jgi:hypothetical protein
VRAIGSHWYIGGDFHPKIVPKNDLPIYYANSKIKRGGGYVWSERPRHKVVTTSDNIATAIDDRATTYSLSQSRGTSSLIAVDAGGRIAPATGAETTLDVLGNVPKFIVSDSRNWHGVGLSGDRLEFVFGPVAAGATR